MSFGDGTIVAMRFASALGVSVRTGPPIDPPPAAAAAS